MHTFNKKRKTENFSIYFENSNQKKALSDIAEALGIFVPQHKERHIGNVSGLVNRIANAGITHGADVMADALKPFLVD